jgi:hypothetical protein
MTPENPFVPDSKKHEVPTKLHAFTGISAEPTVRMIIPTSSYKETHKTVMASTTSCVRLQRRKKFIGSNPLFM